MAEGSASRFEITVEGRFSAAHALRLGGRGEGSFTEPLHGHDWHVTVCIAGERLDDDGLLCDFHTIEDALREITGALHNRNLNDVGAFDVSKAEGLNPSAEHVALYVARELSGMVDSALSPYGARLVWVRVTEAPGCAAVYHLGGG